MMLDRQRQNLAWHVSQPSVADMATIGTEAAESLQEYVRNYGVGLLLEDSPSWEPLFVLDQGLSLVKIVLADVGVPGEVLDYANRVGAVASSSNPTRELFGQAGDGVFAAGGTVLGAGLCSW